MPPHRIYKYPVRRFFMRRNKKSLWSSLPMSIILSVTIGLAAAVGLGCVFSALVYLVLRDMGLSDVLAALSLAAGAYMGSYICGRYRRHRGAVSGIICGAVMFAVIFLAGLALQVDAADIKKLLLLAVSGCTGGVCGVNSKRPSWLMDQ